MAKNILITEDDLFLTKALTAKLSKEEFNVLHAGNGKEALKIAKKNKPNLILLDLIMPEMNGFDALYQLKQDEATKAIPVIVVSNLGEPEDVERVKNLGALDYLLKTNTSLQDIVDKIKERIG